MVLSVEVDNSHTNSKNPKIFKKKTRETKNEKIVIPQTKMSNMNFPWHFSTPYIKGENYSITAGIETSYAKKKTLKNFQKF